jgi:hypothetical protein
MRSGLNGRVFLFDMSVQPDAGTVDAARRTLVGILTEAEYLRQVLRDNHA